jgi:hypothetical protein
MALSDFYESCRIHNDISDSRRMSVIMSGTDESQLQPNELKSTADVQDLHLRTEWAHSGWRRDPPKSIAARKQ